MVTFTSAAAIPKVTLCSRFQRLYVAMFLSVKHYLSPIYKLSSTCYIHNGTLTSNAFMLLCFVYALAIVSKVRGMSCVYKKKKKKKLHTCIIIIIIIIIAIFPAHALREWAWLRAHTNVTTFTRFTQNYYYYREPVCIVVLYYACNYTVTLSSDLIPSLQYWAKVKNTELRKPVMETGRDKGMLALGNKDYLG